MNTNRYLRRIQNFEKEIYTWIQHELELANIPLYIKIHLSMCSIHNVKRYIFPDIYGNQYSNCCSRSKREKDRVERNATMCDENYGS